jgi:CheY-like chemotaxis protein
MRHVLLVDEDPELALAVDRQLAELGCEAVVVGSGEDALRLLEEDLRVDVLLTELRLPDIDGRELALAVCQKRPFIRVAFMGNRAPSEPLEPREAPLLIKPFTAPALANALAEAAPLRRTPRGRSG